jgi:hypothetical protein
MRNGDAQTKWKRVLDEYAIACDEYEAAYRALVDRARSTGDTLTSRETLAEARAREHLISVRRRMYQLDPQREQLFAQGDGEVAAK